MTTIAVPGRIKVLQDAMCEIDIALRRWKIIKPRAVTVVLALLVLTAQRSPAQPVVTTQPNDAVVMEGDTAVFTVTVSGSGPFTYQWRFNGTNLPNNIISTVAGGGPIGDGGPATDANLFSPVGVALDAAGNLFIVDNGNKRIRRMDSGGVISTVAGNGLGGYSGDGGFATNATLSDPESVVTDITGRLFIGDSGNNRIRKVGIDGIITTVAGNGSFGYTGDGGPATNAKLRVVSGVAMDGSGNLFIVDRSSSVVRKVSANGVITTIAGKQFSGPLGDGGAATNASLSQPYGIAVGLSGELFIADNFHARVRRVGTDGIISTVAGNGTAGSSGDGGAATNASIRDPRGVAVDGSGNLFIAEYSGCRIRKVGTNGIISTVAGNGSPSSFGDGGLATSAGLGTPASVAVDASGNLFIAGFSSDRVRKVSTNGVITTVAGGNIGDGGAATNCSLGYPSGVDLDGWGNLFISDESQQRVRKVGSDATITTVAGNGSPEYSGEGGPATNAGLNLIQGIALDSSGNLFISDNGHYRVREVSTNGTISSFAGNGIQGFSGDGTEATNAGLGGPYGLAFDGSGNLFIADAGQPRIRKVDANGVITTVAGNGSLDYPGDGGSATNAGLRFPMNIALDGPGNLFIAVVGDGRVLKVDANGIIRTVAGTCNCGFSGDGGLATNASLFSPESVASDAYGNLFIADNGNNRIREVTTNGIITTVAGNGSAGFSGDGGAATNAALNSPGDIALDAAGNLFIADRRNSRIRKVALAGSPTLALNAVFSNTSGNYSVVVSSPYAGSVTSRVATLTVALPPTIQAFWQAGGMFNFNWLAVSNLSYRVVTTTNLASTNWVNLGSALTATNSTLSASDFISPDAQRFYRVLLLR